MRLFVVKLQELLVDFVAGSGLNDNGEWTGGGEVTDTPIKSERSVPVNPRPPLDDAPCVCSGRKRLFSCFSRRLRHCTAASMLLRPEIFLVQSMAARLI